MPGSDVLAHLLASGDNSAAGFCVRFPIPSMWALDSRPAGDRTFLSVSGHGHGREPCRAVLPGAC